MARDFPGREKKKPKKDAKKAQVTQVIPSAIQPVEVEVVRKRRKKDEFPEE